MKALVIARTNMQRTFRDRTGLFFIVVLPLILIVVLGMTYGGWNVARFGVAGADGGPLARDLVASIHTTEMRTEIRRYASAADLRDAVERGFVQIGLAIPADYDARLTGGETPQIEIVAQPTTMASTVRTAIDDAIAGQAAQVRAARFAAERNGIPFETALAAARQVQPSVTGVGIALESVGDVTSNPNGFTVGAQSQVILFMFLTSLTGATQLILTRQLGISRRMFSTPTGAGTIILGEALGRFAFALFQGGLIVVASAALFGVDWVDPVATAAIVLCFAVVATGAAMLVGTFASNTHQAAALGPALGMVAGLLGGTMVPPEIFPSLMRTLSFVTPHAWAMDAFHALLLRGAGLLEILPQLGIIVAYAVVLLAIAVWRFGRVIATVSAA
ncbi:MAG TPA: ABC transporter permease [Candidatus Limnocylindrales bacterium]